PKLFLQSDSLGVPYQNKSMWSRVLTYNQVTGPVVLEQQRSTKTLCEDGEGVAGDMYCYGQRTSSRDSFGSNQVLPITAPDPREYEGGAVTPAQRRAYYDSAFEVAASSSRRLAEDTRPEFDFLSQSQQSKRPSCTSRSWALLAHVNRIAGCREVFQRSHQQPKLVCVLMDLGAASHHVLECTQVACFWKDTFQVAIYPNTPSDLIAEHVAYIKNREWLDVRIPAE
ncbi:npp-10, partial [Symbiodinium necroappetens]